MDTTNNFFAPAPEGALSSDNDDHSASDSRTFELTEFRHVKDPYGWPVHLTWPQLRERFQHCDVRPQKDGRMISAAIYSADNVYRAAKNVIGFSGLFADFDESYTKEEIEVVITSLGVKAILHSSHSHGRPGPEKLGRAPGERYRVFFPLEQPLSVEEYGEVWEKLNILFGRSLCRSCKSLERAFYLPSHPTGDGYVFQALEGRWLRKEDLPPLPAGFYTPSFTAPDEAVDAGRPGDLFNRAATNETTAQMLEASGWVVERLEEPVWRATRPGKNAPGISATIGHHGPGLLFVFSSNAAPFEECRCYKPFTIKALLEYEGDFGATANALALQGYCREDLDTVDDEIDDEFDDGDELNDELDEELEEEQHDNSSMERETTACDAEGTRTGQFKINSGDMESISKQRFSCDDIGNGKRFAWQHQHHLRFCAAWKSWLHYDGVRWVRDDTGVADECAKATARSIKEEARWEKSSRRKLALNKHARKTAQRAKRTTMLQDAASEPGMSVDANDFDTDPYLLNVANGTLDLRTGQLRPHSSADHISKLAPVIFDPQAECPRFKMAVSSIFANSHPLIDCWQRVCGYALTGDTSEQVAFILHGTGANGKTTIMQIVEEMLGDYAIELEPETIMVRSQERMATDIAQLHNIRLFKTSESSDTHRLNEGKVKKMTGGEKLTGERKFEHPFQFKPQFKLFLVTNKLPDIRGSDEGIWRRLMPFPFDVHFWQAESGQTGPEHLKADPKLIEAFREEASGILNWMLEGCQKWQQSGLTWPREVQAKKAEYREEQDVFGEFLRDECVLSDKACIRSESLFYAYEDWCEASGVDKETSTAVGKKLREFGFKKCKISRPGEKQVRGWRGLRLKTDGEHVVGAALDALPTIPLISAAGTGSDAGTGLADGVGSMNGNSKTPSSSESTCPNPSIIEIDSSLAQNEGQSSMVTDSLLRRQTYYPSLEDFL